MRPSLQLLSDDDYHYIVTLNSERSRGQGGLPPDPREMDDGGPRLWPRRDDAFRERLRDMMGVSEKGAEGDGATEEGRDA
jgi:hypothetical protein